MTEPVTETPAPRAKGVRKTKAARQADQQKALELALAGASYQQIATQMGLTHRSQAHRLVHSALEEWSPLDPDKVDAVRQRELSRLDRLQQAHWMNAIRGDVRAGDFVLRVIDRRARLLGLDAPVKVDATVRDGLDAEIAALVAQLPTPDRG